jgi:heme oxygenase
VTLLVDIVPQESSPASQRGLRAFLKKKTAENHEALDNIFAGFCLDEEKGYQDFLSAHYVAWSAMSSYWVDALENTLEIQAPGYSALLAADLEDMRDGGAEALPTLSVKKPLSDAGLAYVLAGSRLGIGAIARQPTWGNLNRRASRFISDSQGIDIFRRLTAYFDGTQGHLIDRDMALQSAHDCFDAFAAAAYLVKDLNK